MGDKGRLKVARDKRRVHIRFVDRGLGQDVARLQLLHRAGRHRAIRFPAIFFQLAGAETLETGQL